MPDSKIIRMLAESRYEIECLMHKDLVKERIHEALRSSWRRRRETGAVKAPRRALDRYIGVQIANGLERDQNRTTVR